MKLAPSRFNVEELTDGWCASRQIVKHGQKVLVPCRPVGYFSIRNRVKLAWAVFTGKADALFWEQQ